MAKYSKYTVESINSKKPLESKLTAIELRGYTLNYKTPHRLVSCKCECGEETTLSIYSVAHGRTLSCGCHAIDLTKIRSTKYFPVNNHIYDSYKSMMRRCYEVTNQAYEYYGGRGVSVCEEWKNSYQAFLDWSIKNGWEEGKEIDKDIRGNGLLYSPDTCAWVTRQENANNTRNTPKFIFKGNKYTIAQLSRLTGVKDKLLYRRINNYKLSVEEAVSKPNRCQKFVDRQKLKK